MACPGYLQAKANWEHLPDEPDAMRDSGSKTHQALEFIIDGKPVEIPLDKVENFVVNSCDDMGKRLVANVFGDKEVKFFIKNRFWMRDSTGIPLCSGEPDLTATDGSGKWLIVDYKRGPKEVPVATHNWQLQTYATLAGHDAELMKKGQCVFEEVYCAIFQPLVSTRPVTIRLNPEELKWLWYKIASEIKTGMTVKNLPRIPGVHCEYCPVRHLCPEAQSRGIQLQTKASTKGVEALTDDQLTELYPQLNQIIDIAEQAKQQFKRRVAAGAIPGYEIYDHPTGYTIDDPKILFELVQHFFKPDEFRKMMSIPVAQVRDLWVLRFAETYNVTREIALKEWNMIILPALQPLPPQQRVRKIKDVKAQTIAEKT